MATKYLKTVRSIIYNLLFLSFIVSLVVDIPNISLLLSVFTLLALPISVIGIGRIYQLFVGLTLALSLTLLWVYDLLSWEIIYYFSSLTNIMVLLAYAAIFSIPVLLGMYQRKLYLHFKSRVSSFKSLYATFSLTTYPLCSVMSTSAIPTVRSSLYLFLRKLPHHFQKEFQALTFVRPFILILFWTPVGVIPTLAISKTNSDALVVLPILFLISISYLVLDIQTSDWRLRKKWKSGVDERNGFQEEDGLITSKKTNTSLITFFFVLCLFVGMVLFTSSLTGYSILNSVILLIIPYSFLWALALKRGKRYLQALSHRFTHEVPKLSPQVALFISVGFMINVISMTGLSQGINTFLYIIQDLIGPFVLLFISVMVVALTWIGILPQLVMVFVTQTIDLTEVGLKPEWFVLAIVGAALSGSASSPFTVNANIVGITIDEKPFNIVKKNIIFSINILLITSLLAIILQYTYN